MLGLTFIGGNWVTLLARAYPPTNISKSYDCACQWYEEQDTIFSLQKRERKTTAEFQDSNCHLINEELVILVSDVRCVATMSVDLSLKIW